MDELMKKSKVLDQESNCDLTCSVHFVSSGTSSEDELDSGTQLSSDATDWTDLDKSCSLIELGHNFEDVRDWHKIEQPSKNPLRAVLRFMMENNLKTSVQIEINQMYFKCHLIVLQAYSKFFMDLETIPLVVTLPQTKVSQKAFKLIYKWMLSDQPHLERKNIVKVFVAATYLRIDSLLQHCWKYFEDVNCFNGATAYIMYLETKNNPALDIVQTFMLTRIQKFFLTFVATRDFLDLPLKHLICLLSSDDIYLNTEIEIFFTIVRWLGHDWKSREKTVDSLIGCVRFKLMPPLYLFNVNFFETHILVYELIRQKKVKDVILSSLNLICKKINEEKTKSKIEDFAIISRKEQQRQWIQDEQCPYNHLIGCQNTSYIYYSQFESYLKTLLQRPLDSWAKVELIDVKNPKKCCEKCFITRPVDK